MTDLEVFIAACALLIVGVSLFSMAYCAWRAGSWAWREYHAKKRRPGYLLQPTPDRARLGVSQTRGGAAPTARRTTRRSSTPWQPKR